jgi:energy-coupling factor transporter ATP-binding protein EcfA2
VTIRGPLAFWEHRLGSTIVPLLLAERDDLSLHAATVLVGGRAVLLCGPPGRGKSTLAAAMARRGHAVASEDGTVISDVESDPWVWPGQFGVRVTGAAMRALGREPPSDQPEGKFRRLIEDRGEDPLPPAVPAAVVLLRERGGPALEARRLDPVAALPAVAPHAFYGGPERLEITLDRVARLVERVPVWAVRLPDELSRLGECAETILDTVLRSS